MHSILIIIILLIIFLKGNFTQEEIGECKKEVWLEQGDIMYFPRGVIHQALTDTSCHSTHITISTVQKWTWYHYLLKVCNIIYLLNVIGILLLFFYFKAYPIALRAAFESDIQFRKVLPHRFQDYMGIMHSDREGEERDTFISKTMELAELSMQYIAPDIAADLMCLDFLHDSLPPVVSPQVRSN